MASRRPLVVCTVVAMIFIVCPPPAKAQWLDKLTNPKFTVPVTHPPRLVLKGVTRVAVQEIAGECGAELTDRLTEAISQSGKFEVVDRSSLEQIFQEKGLQASGAVSGVTTAKLGEMLGAAALLTGRISRCKTTVGDPLNAGQSKDWAGVVHTTYVRKTTVTLLASLKIIDVTTGKTYTPAQIDGTIVEETRARDGYPEAADENQVLSHAYQKTVELFLQNILPWQETVTLTVFNDDKYSLKLSSNQMKSGQFEEAAQTIKTAIDTGGGDDAVDKKLLSKAYYNLGIALMYAGRPEDGLADLQKSQVLRQTDIANQAITTCHRMIDLNRIAESRETNAVEIGTPAADRKTIPGNGVFQKAEILTNSDIIEMVKAKMSDTIILAKINSSKCEFDTTTKGLVSLKSAGVSDGVLQAMTGLRK